MGRLSVGDIPGYGEALAKEQQARAIAYLDVPFDCCGFRLNQMTPRIRAALFASGSPFVHGSAITIGSVIQFLWACSVDYSASRFARWKFVRSIQKRMKRGLELQTVVDEIDEYLDVTFQDAPAGGKSSIPYASELAWLEFRMCGEPWRWGREQLLATPYRVIYQQLRCAEMSEGHTPVNRSDYVRQDYLDKLNAQNRFTGDS